LLLVAWDGRRAAAATPDAGQDLTPTARELSDQALRQYQQGDFDAAIESFMGAFALSNNPGLLFNVAQAYRLKGDCEHARDYYQRYLRAVPETPFKPSLERRVAEMEACLKSAGSATTAAGTGNAASGVEPRGATMTTTALAAPPSANVTSSKPEASARRRAVVWTLRGSAVTLLASSAVFGALAWDAHRDFDNAPTPSAALDPSNRYKTDTALTWTFAASGVAFAVISYFVDRHR
jgi:tetratricopeptide (TPR) repeat protein